MTDTTERNGLEILEITEAVFVVSSIAGSLATIAGQTALSTVTPLALSVAISLNLFNRRRFDRTFQENITVVLSEMATRVRQVDQQLSGEIESVRTSVKTLSPGSATVNLEPIHTEISQLQKRFDSIEHAIGSLGASNKLSDSNLPMEGRSPTLAEGATQFDPTYLEKQIEEIKAVVKNTNQSSVETATKEEIQQLQANISSISEGFNQRIEQVRQITSEVQYHLSTLPPPPANVESNSLQQQIQQLQANFTALSNAFERRDELRTIEELRRVTAQLQSQPSQSNQVQPTGDLTTLQQELVEPRPSFAQLETEIQQLKAEIKSLQHQIKSAPSSEAAADVDGVEIESIYEEIKPNSNPFEYIGNSLNKLGECIGYYQQQFFQPQHLIIEPDPEQVEFIDLNEPNPKKANAALNNWSETVVAKMLQSFDGSAEKEKEISPAEQFDALMDEIKQTPSEEVKVSSTPTDVNAAIETELNNPQETKSISLESLIEVARQNGIEDEFNLAIEAGKKHNLALNPWPTNLMFSPPSELLAGAKPNLSQCLFIIAAQPTAEGKVKLWVSPQSFAEFYQIAPATVTSVLGEDGWQETDKAGIEEFVAKLDLLFQQIADRLLKAF